LDTVVDGLLSGSSIAIAMAIAVLVLGFGVWWTFALDRGTGLQAMNGGSMDNATGGDMAGMAAPDDVPRLPPVAAYYDGEQVFFVHAETSDPEISDMLTGMMDSPVVTVPQLAHTPGAALAPVYVFTNGVRPDGARGPLGFQPDVFDTVPGDLGYTPLRRLVKVTWARDAELELLTSEDQITEALDAGELTVQRTGIVINAPLLTWPGGQR
jgi:hypothetical protein